ncbi:MAG: hypothetical protein HZB55_14375 [Deltaproteobacteria bacterium]|nr:hypothetical protein [Deltaproteobacteria bacterium]
MDDASLNLVRARTNLAKARRDYLVARVTLEWVMGTMGETRSSGPPPRNAPTPATGLARDTVH